MLFSVALLPSVITLSWLGGSAASATGTGEVVVKDLQAEFLSAAWGVSPARAADIIQQQNRALELSNTIAANDSTTFAGVAAGGDGSAFTVFSTAPESDRPRVLDLAAHLGVEDVAVTAASYSLQSLNEVQQAIIDKIMVHDTGSRFWVGLDLVQNGISVFVNMHEATIESVKADIDLVTKFDRIEYFEDPSPPHAAYCNDWACTPPLRAGVQLYHLEGGAVCSSGFAGKSRVTGSWQILTAGHCGFGRWISNNSEVGYVANRSVGGNSDAETINISNPSFWNPCNCVYFRHYAGGTAFIEALPMTSSANGTTYVQNASVCQTGQTSRVTNCGQISSISVAANYDGIVIQDAYHTRACSRGGDSGGPMFSGNTAYGTIAAAADCVGGDGYNTGDTTGIKIYNESNTLSFNIYLG